MATRRLPVTPPGSYLIIIVIHQLHCYINVTFAGGVQPQLQADPSHEAGKPSLQARDASADDPHQLHGDHRWSRGPTVGRRRQQGTA